MDPPTEQMQRKQKLTNVVIGFLFLLSGIEYAVILPTVWLYLQSLGAHPFFLGLVLSAFSLTELLSGPLFGHWTDRTGRTKNVILLSNCFEIAGNFMYFVGISKWFLFGSRLVAGVGAGSGASIFGYLTRFSSAKDRVPVFAMAMACRQAGLLIGPAFNIFLRYSNFYLGPFHVNKYSAPGIFMCVLWVLMQLMVAFMFYDVPLSSQVPQVDEHEPLLKQPEDPSEGVSHVYGSINSDNQETDHVCLPPEDNAPSSNHKEEVDHSSYSTLPNCQADPQNLPNGPQYVESGRRFHNLLSTKGYMHEEVVVLLTAQFVTLFNQTALEALVTPLAQTYLGFQDLQNSLLYFLCGIEMLAGFLAVRLLSRCCSDRLLLALGLIVCNISCIWCLVFLAKPNGSYGALLGEFVVGVFLQVLGLPFVSVSQVSLFSKVTAENTQGFSHGLRRSVGGLATILGPLWAAGLTQELYIMLGVMMGLLLLLTGMVSLSYRYLVDPVRSGI
ncbi:major facilitator superfamily domain-containing protein 8-like [Bombina bombina]|uniref:major facilitator superfamily domain-containing protein 8-like n=1 Tax=Bombina bombina TaxID=8345 RepID=UPI00235A5214|nr:major facilitator superfamily domain-containing protein 8-like [Bombina bombina]